MALDKGLITLNAERLGHLHNAWLDGKLTIIVGAGASLQSGLPIWDQLLREMLTRHITTNAQGTPNEFFVDDIRDHLRDQLGNSSPLMFAHSLGSKLDEESFLTLVH